MQKLAITPLTEALLPATLELDQRCFGGLWSIDGYRREMASPNSELLVLQSFSNAKSEALAAPVSTEPISDTLLAIGCCWAILEEAHITIVAVDPAYRQQGLGQTMLWALLDSAQKKGLERATLEVRVSNQRAIALYTKFGFCAAGRRRRYYQDNNEDALLLWQSGLQTPAYRAQLAQWYDQVCDRLRQSGWQLSDQRISIS